MTEPVKQETWRKERMYGEADTVLWAILSNGLRVVGSFLNEADADQAIADHNAAQRVAVLEAALREALRMVNNKHVAEVYSTNPRGDVNTFCIALRDRLADTLAALAALNPAAKAEEGKHDA